MANKKAKNSARSKQPAAKSGATEKTKTENKATKSEPKATISAEVKSAAKSETKVFGANVADSQPKEAKVFKGFFAKKYKNKETLDSAIHSPKFLAALAGELIGTFLLAMAILTTGSSPLFVLFGAVGAAIIVATISGANLNPAITVGHWVTRRISAVRMLFYIIAQVLGAMLAYIALKFFLGGGASAADAYGTSPEVFSMVAMPDGKMGYLIAIELIGALIYAFGFARSLQYKRSTFTMAFTIGLGFFAAVLFALTASNYVGGGYAINPATAVAMEAFTKEGTNFWFAFATYAGAPIVGGVLGFLLSDVLSRSSGESIEQ